MGTHYETLGVKPSASTSEIRKAYLRRARALHPDRQLDRSEADARKAEEAMQVVNAAWDILSDPKKKSEYDKRLGGGRTGGASTVQRSQQSAQQRPAQPRPANPNTAYRQQTSSSTTSSSASSGQQSSGGIGGILASIPVLILIGVLVGVIIVVFFLNNDNTPTGPTLIDNELAVQDCFVLVGNTPREVACDSGQADGQVTAVGPDRGNCPESSQLPLRDPDSDFYLCWARIIPGSSNTVP